MKGSIWSEEARDTEELDRTIRRVLSFSIKAWRPLRDRYICLRHLVVLHKDRYKEEWNEYKTERKQLKAKASRVPRISAEACLLWLWHFTRMWILRH